MLTMMVDVGSCLYREWQPVKDVGVVAWNNTKIYRVDKFVELDVVS
jgi:hypothetical protein